jgi:hypothetical protein
MDIPRVSKPSVDYNRKCENDFCDFALTKVRAKYTLISDNNGQQKWLCQSCLKIFNKGDYCFYCMKSSEKMDGKNWIACDNIKCGKWVSYFT